MIKKIPVVFSAIVLGSCGTPEFQAEKGLCEAEWMRKIPPRYEQEMYNQLMSRQVPTGQVTCTTFGYTTNCTQVMRTEFYTVASVRTVDRNKNRRDSNITECTQQKCLQKYGNTECKPK
jgi:hypothetical protein